MLRLSAVIFSAICLVSCAVAPVKEGGLSQIKPGGIHEECFTAKKGTKVLYSFYTSLPVDFNVHYHAGEKIYYPFERKGTTMEDGTYVPDHEDTYCFMWTNKNKAQVTLNYKYEIQPMVKPAAPPEINRPQSQPPAPRTY